MRMTVATFLSGCLLAAWVATTPSILLAQNVAAPDGEMDPADRQQWDVPEDTPATLDGGETLNPALFGPVRDHTVGLEYVDRPAYFYGLWLCEQVDPATLAQFARKLRDERQAANPRYKSKPKSQFPQFVDVFQNPNDYRGKPVTLQGYFRKLVKYDAGANDLGIGQVYEGWLYTDDSQSNPAVVVFTGKPPGLPLGGDITEEVRFTGYFLKMYGYQAQDTVRKAPMFVAGKVDWFPSRAANERAPVSGWVYGAVTLGLVLGIWLLWYFNQKRPHSGSRFSTAGRDFDQFPPQEFVGDGHKPTAEPHH